MLSLLGTSIYAAEPPTSAAIQPDATQRQQQRDDALQKQIQPEPSVQTGLEKQLQRKPQLQFLKSHSEEVCFEIKKFVLIGEDARQFTFAMRPVTQGQYNLIGRCIGVQGLNQALDLIQNDLISHGYVTTRMLLPQQNIASGTIQLKVVAGKVDQIKFVEGTSKRAHKWNALPVKSGGILNVRDIEQGLENFKRVPTVEADFKIKPSEQRTEPGYSDLELAWHQSKPYRLHLGIDDAGSDSTGKYQGTATLSLDNLLTANDLFYGSYNHDLGGGDSGKRGTDGFYLSYSIPYQYWLLNTSYSQSNYNQTVAGANQSYNYSGKSKLIGADLSRVLYRDAKRKTSASVGGWYRESQNFINDVEVEVQRRKTAGWKASLDHSEYLANATLTGNVTYKRGTGAFSAMRAPEEQFNEAYTRVGILQANASLQVPFQVGQQNLQYLAEWRMQHSNKALTPQDRFSIGNRYTVRGFDGEQTLMADNGFLVRNELSGSVAKLPMQWYSGIDYGEVGGTTAHYPNPLVGTSLLGAVVGLRGQVFKSVSYDAFVGAPLKKPEYFKTDDFTTGFSVNWMY
ncbi:ShlB/FhaC/HecB family hemolysin secretion/activation protein [Acinetobacter higginsii]|uniref:ShlB/FhaC/HecB family hemolysin secretion/activation protein n=1 Tax=Acinetobacter higginsii TaxID=70347 RepID=UPI001F4A0E58|nr:ShlB/FhaC/HecB family hemolysin secretion/activation protein [Acinetobacter higginsii]MCH7293720.1 ShlB/FhaC/HecB family hemolysin secretion/activation protein [Acinetobacter higginsii]